MPQIMPENNDIARKPLKCTVNLLIVYMSPHKFFLFKGILPTLFVVFCQHTY